MADSHSIRLVFSNAAFPLILELSFVLKNQAADKRGHSFDHDHKVIAALIHVPDVFLAEVSPVKDEAYSFIAVSLCFFQCHSLQLLIE